MQLAVMQERDLLGRSRWCLGPLAEARLAGRPPRHAPLRPCASRRPSSPGRSRATGPPAGRPALEAQAVTAHFRPCSEQGSTGETRELLAQSLCGCAALMKPCQGGLAMQRLRVVRSQDLDGQRERCQEQPHGARGFEKAAV